jgi:hypothetical protein
MWGVLLRLLMLLRRLLWLKGSNQVFHFLWDAARMGFLCVAFAVDLFSCAALCPCSCGGPITKQGKANTAAAEPVRIFVCEAVGGVTRVRW